MGNTYPKKEYTESDSVKQAQQALQNQQAQKPGAYQSQYQAGMDNLMGQIQNRPKFQYDVNSDALYQQVAQNYIRQGQQAMMDTMGQASALTGGYGNSYAQNAGQQAYQSYLQGLTDLVPQYQQMAYQQYQAEGDDLLNKYALLAQQEESAYGRYQDDVNQYYAELDRLQSAYDNERDYDYGRFADDRDFDYGQYMDQLNYQYQLDRDKVADEQWQKEFDENMRRYNQEWAAQQAAASGSSSGSGGRGNGNGSTNSKYGNMSYTQLMQEMSKAGTSANGASLADAMIAGGANADTVMSLWKMFFDHDSNGTEDRKPSKNANEYITRF